MPRFITSDEISIEYDSKGIGQTVILIHGFGGEGSSFRVLDKILSKSYNTIEMDLRGHGKSGASINTTIDVMAKDLKELIKYLNLTNPVLVGWSMGGSVLLEYIRQFGTGNISGLILIEASPMITSEEEWRGALFKGSYSKEQAIVDIQAMKSNWDNYAELFVRKMAPNLDKRSLELAIDKIAGNDPDVMSAVWSSLISKDYRDLISKIEIPVLVISGADSTFYDPKSGEDIAKMFPLGQQVIIDRAGHMLVMENPVALSTAITEFIDNNILK